MSTSGADTISGEIGDDVELISVPPHELSGGDLDPHFNKVRVRWHINDCYYSVLHTQSVR